MVTTHDQRLKDGAKAHIDAAGESIQYKQSAELEPVSINALVFRHAPEPGEGDNERSLRRPIEIVVAAKDIAAVDLEGPDTVKLPPHLDAEAVWRPVTAIVAESPGEWKLAVGR